MMTMTNKKLKELLNQYPDETLIYISNGDCANNIKDIAVVTIEYINGDDYQLPQIILS